MLLSWILPSVVVAYLWIARAGPGRRHARTRCSASPGTAWLVEYPMASLIVFNTWRGTAFSMMLYSSALAAVPPSQLETARTVGASGWQTVRDVVFPHIRGHVLTNTLLISLWTANDFTPFLLTAGGPNHESETLPVFIYQQAIASGRARLRGGDLVPAAAREPGGGAGVPAAVAEALVTSRQVLRRIGVRRVHGGGAGVLRGADAVARVRAVRQRPRARAALAGLDARQLARSPSTTRTRWARC